MSRILTARHRWIYARIAETFGTEASYVERCMGQEENFNQVTDFFSGEGPSKLIIFHQKPTPEEGEDASSWTDEEKVIFVTSGDKESDRMHQQACYFLRNCDGSVDTQTACDDTVLFGELSASPLRSLESALSKVFRPSFEKRDNWGRAEDEQITEFKGSLDKFLAEMQDALKSVVGGLELRKPDKKYDVARQAAPQGREDPEAINHFASLMQDWCDKIDQYLEDKDASSNFQSSDMGPLTELEYWRRRMQRLTSITEQIKTPECRNVIARLNNVGRQPQDDAKSNVASLTKRWRQVDLNITEANNEAKDNVKYLMTLEKFIEPLYTGTPQTIIDTLTALMNSIKMIHTIARYYSTTERMTLLFTKTTNQMITNCKIYVNGNDGPEKMWEKDPSELASRLEMCLQLNERYQEQYRLTKDKLLTMPKSKQFDFSETQIFGKFDLFCRRVIKLIDMFSTIHQFQSLSVHNLEGMEHLVADFKRIIDDFKSKRHDLLDYGANQFDRDYVEFNVSIGDLERKLQDFINQSFESITSIDKSLNLLKKFQTILQRENLKSDLDSKFNVIFHNYGAELEQVQQLYEKHKHAPQEARNLPPVAGNIMWSRHLLNRIEEPMKKFQSNQNVLGTKDAKRIIRTYNKVARTLVAFEYLWYQAWVNSIETSKAGLQATLIIRHPDDGKLYVNFDQEILQLIREAKCLDRMGIEVPESAKIVLLQEDKFKSYYNELQYALKEYNRVTEKIIPVTAQLLQPHINDMEYKLRPGMITLTWTSMNIDAYRHHVHSGLIKLEELVSNINDIVENRIEKNLKIVSKKLLVELPDDQSFALDEFVSMQERVIEQRGIMLQDKNVEIENAVEDLLHLIVSFPLDSHVEPVSPSQVEALRKHYNSIMYQALLHCTKMSLNMLKKRVGSRGGSSFLFVERPFFEVDVQLAVPAVRLSPSLDEIQRSINKSAQAALRCSKQLCDWGQRDMPMENRITFFERITKDIEIVRVVLLLTGSVQGLRNQVHEYLKEFRQYDWLWKDDKDQAYKIFMRNDPQLEDYERELRRFGDVEDKIALIAPIHIIGALSLNTTNLKLQLKHEGSQWKVQYSDNLHNQAREKMEALSEYMKLTLNKINRDVVELDDLRFAMSVLKEVRERESGIEMEFNPVLDMYQMLEHFLPDGYMDKDEMDKKSVLRFTWRKLVMRAEEKTDELSKVQQTFRKQLLKDIKEFLVDVMSFRHDYINNGPMVPNTMPADAVQRLKRYQEEYEIRERKYQLYRSGEELFALPRTDYPELTKTKKELQMCTQLYDLYTEVLDTIGDYRRILWQDVIENIDTMSEKVEAFQSRCTKMPRKLREGVTKEAYSDLKKEIDDFQTVLPLLQELSKPSIKTRHWGEVMKVTGTNFTVDSSEFKLQTLLDAHIVDFKEEIEEITEGADKQLGIENNLGEIKARWAVEEFQFMEWKGRGVSILKAWAPVIEELEEAQMKCQTMLSMRHVTPFRDEVQSKLTQLSETSDTLELWTKVQMLWCSLESVFTGGDIAKQMPLEAKKFAKIDKDWVKCMAKAQEQAIVVSSCANEYLKNTLPVMYSELEKCQKSLDGYLEQKRNRFPRFYFVSGPSLLQILSQGSDPTSMTKNGYYEKVSDSITFVNHDKSESTKILQFATTMKGTDELLDFVEPVTAKGNIEDWLGDLVKMMQKTMKDKASQTAQECQNPNLRGFVDNVCAQMALLGIQFMWTSDCQTALQQCRQKRTIMNDTNKRTLEVLRTLSGWCLDDLKTNLNRCKIETLVTIQVHQRDVMNDLTGLYKQKQINSAEDFEWSKQARFYWREDSSDKTSEHGALVVSVTDVDFAYQYEYIGVADRLAITPLTDRCYITLAQALGMSYGGAPAGPAGTGKTETVKDLGRALGIYVVVTNCTDQMSYLDCAKIFKGLCQGGLWGCFDEFNRITLPVLSVVAQQVLAIQNAKKAGVATFQFPGESMQVELQAVCGFFITMNPGYAGRQELPENLKALFRGVTMMVPDREIIMKVKLCAVGYEKFPDLARKFATLYAKSEMQLSKQKHYDFGLRNILSVLRTAGAKKRAELQADEFMLLYRTLRDMNLSKMVAQDVPLFLSLLKDLFPGIPPPPKAEAKELEEQLERFVNENELVQHEDWKLKVVQFHDTLLVRHGIMLVGPTGGGKSTIMRVLTQAREVTDSVQIKHSRLNPKAIRAAEMYGEVDALSGEWVTGVFASMWTKCNRRDNSHMSWLICDGPVDAIWIEDLNTVLDDNRILTLANGDRIPMTDMCKILFEVENLSNASPATVSRAGIIYVSDSDLGWTPIVTAWLRKQGGERETLLTEIFDKFVGKEVPPADAGHIFSFLSKETEESMTCSYAGKMQSLMNLLDGLFKQAAAELNDVDTEYERIFLYSLTWTVGGLLEPEDRVKWDAYLRSIDTKESMPECEDGETIYEYFINEDLAWERWTAPEWECPQSDKLDFANLLVPTMDSTRSLNLVRIFNEARLPVLMIGASGTAKTTTALMYVAMSEDEKMMFKQVNFSSLTTPGQFQQNVESELDKRGGKNYGPPNGKKMLFFLDDMSMPNINNWGDQPTLECVRMLVESSGFVFLEKDKRGDIRNCEDLMYIGAMAHPGGGKNDIPSRLKRHFLCFNLILPSLTSINDIYGQMLQGRISAERGFNAECIDVSGKLTMATIELWNRIKQKMLPTPAKFHYLFNMRELSRAFCGILLTPPATITEGGLNTKGRPQDVTLLSLWRHECDRVFCDKLTNDTDKNWYLNFMEQHVLKHFGKTLAEATKVPDLFVDFLNDDVYDEDGILVEAAPKIYEPAGTTDQCRDRVQMFMDQRNTEFPAQQMHLVLFDDALRHLVRISRIIQQPRGSALLVGVGGSGKQSLTRLAAYIARHFLFQITLTKSYNESSLLDDLRLVFKEAGHKLKPVTFIFTDAEIKRESFLEFFNSILLTGDVPGLIPKDEMMGICGDLQPIALDEREDFVESFENLKAFFTDKVRENLHIVLCMSPVNKKFAERARAFPGLVSGCTIDWFLPWPEEALVAVSKGFLTNYPIECEEDEKIQLMEHCGTVHNLVVETCAEYFDTQRRDVTQTPKSYLSFLNDYKGMYNKKLDAIKVKEGQVKLGLEKLIKGAEDVEAMKLVLADEQVKLEKATADTNKMLGQLEVSSAEARKENEAVQKIKSSCEEEASRIGAEKAACEDDVAKARPFLEDAESAAASLKAAHIAEVKKLGKPADIIKLVFDGVLILFGEPTGPVKKCTLNVKKEELEFLEPSWQQALGIMGQADFLQRLLNFDRDGINDETIELLMPYIELQNFVPAVAKGASIAAEGLCKWVIAMKMYNEASKIVKPKLEALAVAEGELSAAMAKLQGAEERLAQVQGKMAELKNQFETQMAEKQKIEDGAAALQRKMNQASALIGGLSGERTRWTEDAANFESTKKRLVGDCAVASAFISYCGPFNQEYRTLLVADKFTKDCEDRRVPVTRGLDVISFLVDQGTIGDWNMQGLPTDPLSTQNGILVTRSTRYPLLIDPQGQAISWLMTREAERLPLFGAVAISSPKLKDQLEFCMSEGKAMIVVGVEEELDPMLDPVLQKEIIKKAKSMYINVADKMCEFDSNFTMAFITRLPNPKFSPELQAKTTVIDFTVTQKGLEEQLLGRVIGKEQKALEDQLQQVLEEVNNNTKSLAQLDVLLLERLTSGTGNLLDDEELIGVLDNTKAKANEVKEKLIAADETKRTINEKREQYRPVATRGSVLYFGIVEQSNINPMYNTSLAQFLGLFMGSMDKAEKAALIGKRVGNIIDTMTYSVYRYINRGLYEKDKLTFVLIVTLKILITAGLLSPADMSLFLRGGAALDINSVKKKPFTWMDDAAWLNTVQLSTSCGAFKTLPEDMGRNEAMWRRWFEEDAPEKLPVPDYEMRLVENKETGPFQRLLIVRSLRPDRAVLMCKDFIRNTEQMGERYVEPVTDTIESIYEEMVAGTPVIYLLSVGADPTDAIEQLARKKKQQVVPISMGQGQEPIAVKQINAAAVNGTWVLLQNCDLGLDLMEKMEDMIIKLRESVEPGFRLFITASPTPAFPLGLLQMSTKVTNEPPNGLRAGLMRSYTVMVDQDRLERIETQEWRACLYALCFLHSIVCERRKFGALGWCETSITPNRPEFSYGDLGACIAFLERHLYAGQMSWPTLQYMVSQVQYGGKMTDDMDRRLFDTYAAKWLSASLLDGSFTYNPEEQIAPMPDDYNYSIPASNGQGTEIGEYRSANNAMPELDSPEVFGLHPNADLTFRTKEVNSLLDALSETQPKTGGGGGGQSREDVVYEKATELLERLPADFVEDEFKKTIVGLGGLSVPLNMFLFQEIQRLQKVIAKVRFVLTQMQGAINGEVVMTPEFQQALDSIYDARVPPTWLHTPGGDEFSWLNKTLGLWFTSLMDRDKQYREWLSSGRPNSYWMTGFFNPQGFLTGMNQEVVLNHKAEKWALDDVVTHSEVTQYADETHVKQAPKEGVYVHGLFLDGASWSKEDGGTLVEMEPKKLYTPLPVLYVSGVTKPQKKEFRSSFGPFGPYECAVYKYPARGDRYLIFMATIRTTTKNPQHWIVRGAALLCAI